MDKVYIVFNGIAYEGETVLGIYSSLDKANVFLVNYLNHDYYKMIVPHGTQKIVYECESGNSWYSIEEREVE